MIPRLAGRLYIVRATPVHRELSLLSHRSHSPRQIYKHTPFGSTAACHLQAYPSHLRYKLISPLRSNNQSNKHSTVSMTISPLPLRPHERVLTNPDGCIDTPPRAPSPVHNFGTLAVHAGAPIDPTTGAVIAPISLSTTFAQTAVGKPIGLYEYSRSSNPNRDNFEEAIAALEHARFALAFSSGSATTATILQSLAAGSHVISVSDVYGGTHRYFTKVAAAHGVQVTFSNSIELDVSELIRPDDTKLIWIESPSNPTLSLVDIRSVASVAHKHGILVVVDNTFLSPYVQNPLDHGADIVVHSVTKYIN
jgi:cystathionine gamma-lyase